MRLVAHVCCLLILSVGSLAQATTVFSGRPMVKISEAGTDRVVESLSREKAVNFECVISRIGDKYYWATRENKQLLRHESPGALGAFVTFVAVDGSGYIRIIKPEMKKAASVASDTEAEFDYVEHMLIGLKTLTYYGVSKAITKDTGNFKPMIDERGMSHNLHNGP